VPDETAVLPQWQYIRPKQATWPQADFIVGNPPFIGAKYLRDALGDGYAEALRKTWPEVPESADFVMHWWSRAALLVAKGKVKRFGLITTNSLPQTFNRRVVQSALDAGLYLSYAIADHPWVDNANGAAVRIAMTVGQRSKGAASFEGHLFKVTNEVTGEHGEVTVTLQERLGAIHADLSVGANVASAVSLRAMEGISSPGVKLHGAGFIVTPSEAKELGLGKVQGLEQHIREYRHGRDLTDVPRGVKLIDLYGLSDVEVRSQFPSVYQHIHERVKPEREAKGSTKDGEAYARLWWLHGKPRQEMRKQLSGLSRYIVTVVTAKHRTFQFLDQSILADDALICIASTDAFHLGVLSSHLHSNWALSTGSHLGVGNDPRYIKSRCFETFPFPDVDTGLTPELRSSIASLAEQIDAHRKRQQAAHPSLTLTGMYNVLEALRLYERAPAGVTPSRAPAGVAPSRAPAGDAPDSVPAPALSAKEKLIHTQGLVAVLKTLHDELDAAVLAAYGLPEQISTDALLESLVQLNARRAAEEAAGRIRWLRPEFQDAAHSLLKDEHSAQQIRRVQADLALNSTDSSPSCSSDAVSVAASVAAAWPSKLSEQVRAVAQCLASAPQALSLPEIEARFKGRGPWKNSLPRILETLEVLGKAQRTQDCWRGESTAP
jgi:hypothetical protein